MSRSLVPAPSRERSIAHPAEGRKGKHHPKKHPRQKYVDAACCLREQFEANGD
jgi:hypothetical protein